MCGIAGIISHHARITNKEIGFVQEMNQAMLHRGPDVSGFYSDQKCALAMRRLSIIDIAQGNQPIWNEDRTIGVIFNGEIYNYPELKRQLCQEGHQFRTHADTEVLVHLYESYGVYMLDKLKGMFAFCIYDSQASKFLIARDRFGEKPFFYADTAQKFSFASEINALLKDLSIRRALNHEALPYYLRTSLVPDPLTMFKGIKSLPPGHYMEIENGEVKVSPYFQIKSQTQPQISSEKEGIALITPLLKQAVKRQMISDVPIAAFLSGGLDSSTMVALMQQQSSKPIKTFNVRFEESAYDESYIARKVADYYSTDHHEIFIPNQEFDESLFWDIISHVGQPFRDTSAIPSYLVSKAISKHVKVAISGDGGDELFGGYDLFGWYQKIRVLHHLPSFLRKGIKKGLHASERLISEEIFRKLNRGVLASELNETDLAVALNEQFTLEQIRQLYRSTGDASSDRYRLPSQSSDLRKIMAFRMKYTLPGNMLVKVDRMSMANSLEVRSPFLDADLYAASTRLSDGLLRKGKTGKYLMRKIMRNQMPEEVFDHPKQGFNLPLHRFQNKSYRDLAENLVLNNSEMNEIFQTDAIHQIYKQGIEATQTRSLSTFRTSHQLWMLMQLSGWIKQYNVQL